MSQNETYEQILKLFDEAILNEIKQDAIYAAVDMAFHQGWKEGYLRGYEDGYEAPEGED